jgi:hypothetical protein
LYLSPKGTRILDDGWVWHPVGIPVVWSVDQWLSGNIWESEDGKTKRDVCARNYYWDHGVAWINEETVAIGGIGDDETEIVEGLAFSTSPRPDLPALSGGATGSGPGKSRHLPDLQEDSSVMANGSTLPQNQACRGGIRKPVLGLAT